jgi:excisionase family DNA binding protein
MRQSSDTVSDSRKAVRTHSGRLLDICGAAGVLGCSERFVRRLVQERRIPFVKLGGTKVRFSESELDKSTRGAQALMPEMGQFTCSDHCVYVIESRLLRPLMIDGAS